MLNLKNKLLDWLVKKALERQKNALENLNEDEDKEKLEKVSKIIKRQEEIIKTLDEETMKFSDKIKELSKNK